MPSEYSTSGPASNTMDYSREAVARFEATQLTTPLPSVGPRGTLKGAGQAAPDLIGKVRLLLVGETSQSLANVYFLITARIATDQTPVVLAQGVTDAVGYSAVNMSGVQRSAVTNLAVELELATLSTKQSEHCHCNGNGISSGSDSTMLGMATRFIAPIEGPAWQLYRDMGLAHLIRVPARVIPYLRRAPHPVSGRVDDADAADATISPATFSFGVEEVDGTCCLRSTPELASRQYFFYQTVRVSDPQLVRKNVPEPDNPATCVNTGRLDIHCPIPFGDESTSTYEDKAGSYAFGVLNVYRQAWYPTARGLGELAYSLPLAPLEQVRVAMIDWSRSQRDARDEERTEGENLQYTMHRDRSIDEAVFGLLKEHQEGSSWTVGGGASLNLLIFSIGGGGGYSSSSSDGQRELEASTVQNISDSIVQQASALRGQRIAVVTTSFQEEDEQIQTRTVENNNRNHAMTVQYFQVLSHYRVRTELVERIPLLLLPYEIDADLLQDLPSYEEFKRAPVRTADFLLRHESTLRPMVPATYRPAFDALRRVVVCPDVFKDDTPFATGSVWRISLGEPWRRGLSLQIETFPPGESIDLRSRVVEQNSSVAHFESNPINLGTIRRLRITYDAVTAMQALRDAGFEGVFNPERFLEYHLTSCEIHVRTDPTRFLKHSLEYNVAVEQPTITLSPTAASATLNITPPSISFADYVSPLEMDYCLARQLVSYMRQDPMRYYRAIWMSEDSDRRLIRLDKYRIGDRSVVEVIENRAVGIVGNMVAFPLLRDHHLAPRDNQTLVVGERLISLPTRGVFAEVFLSCCNATELRDISRLPDLSARGVATAPEIAPIVAGSRRDRGDTTPAALPAPIVNVQTVPEAPQPTAIERGLGVLGTANLFRDMSQGAALLDFVSKTTLESMRTTREGAELAAQLAQKAAAASAGGPSPAGGTNDPGTTGSSLPDMGRSGDVSVQSSRPTFAGSRDSWIPTANRAVNAAAAESVRSTPPSVVYDQLQNVARAQQAGFLSPAEASATSRNILGLPPSDTEVGAEETPQAGRRPLGSLADALALVDVFAQRSEIGQFTPLRDNVADTLRQTLRNPSGIDQGDLNLCGPAAFFNRYVMRDPLGFARYVIGLYEDGIGPLGSLLVQPGDDLKGQIFNPAWGCPSAQWIAMSALRDSTNAVWDYEGTPGEDFSAITMPSSIEEWMRASGLYSNIRNETNLVFTKGLEHAMALDPENPNTDVILFCSFRMFTPPIGFVDRITSHFPNHEAVLTSRVRLSGDSVSYHAWTWAEDRDELVPRSQFEDNYYGAIVGVVR